MEQESQAWRYCVFVGVCLLRTSSRSPSRRSPSRTRLSRRCPAHPGRRSVRRAPPKSPTV